MAQLVERLPGRHEIWVSTRGDALHRLQVCISVDALFCTNIAMSPPTGRRCHLGDPLGLW